MDWVEAERLDQKNTLEQMASLAREVAALKRENETLKRTVELVRDQRDAIMTTLQNKRRGEKRGALPRLSPRPLNRPVTVVVMDGVRVMVQRDFTLRTYKRYEVTTSSWDRLTVFLIRDGLFDVRGYSAVQVSLASGEPDEFWVEELTFPRKEVAE